MASKSFHDLLVWQKAHRYVVSVYTITRSFPAEEKYGLWSQFTRAAVSIPANIAEGYKRLSKSEKLRFLNIAQGSLEECRYYTLLSKDLGYINADEYNRLNVEVENVSKFLNFYAKGIIENIGLKD